ncbi:MAG: HAD family hydrolase [Hyphomicrobiaceae bacterium]
MENLSHRASSELSRVDYVLCDLDDTLTIDGKLPPASYSALAALEAAGIAVVVVTGRPAGWCDMIARMWPVSAVVGENGAFYFRYIAQERRLVRHLQRSEAQRRADRQVLETAWQAIKARHPELELATDQPYRISDYAVNFCEDMAHPGEDVVSDVVRMFEASGALAKVSSIHVNAWIGTFTKVDMSLALLQREFGVDAETARTCVVYAGDSPNDEPMFEYFPLSVGVANIRKFTSRMRTMPRWITDREGGHGFEELAKAVIAARSTG